MFVLEPKLPRMPPGSCDTVLDSAPLRWTSFSYARGGRLLSPPIAAGDNSLHGDGPKHSGWTLGVGVGADEQTAVNADVLTGRKGRFV